MWKDHLGSLNLFGDDAVFINLAAVAGPVQGKDDAMLHVNYRAPIAAATACESLGFSHWVQSSTQATNAERAGQVPYSRGKAMADYALNRINGLPVSIACLGLLYCKWNGSVGQENTEDNKINLIDLALLPLCPIVGSGSAPLQPQEVTDAAERIAFLALCDPATRPLPSIENSSIPTQPLPFIHQSHNSNSPIGYDYNQRADYHMVSTFYILPGLY